MHMARLAAPALLAAAALLPRPAAAQGPAAPALQLAQVFDSATVVEALRALPPREGSVRPIFRVLLDSAGAVRSVEAASRVPESYGRAVAAVLSAHARGVPGRGHAGLLLHAEGGPAAVLARPDGEMSGPELMSRAAFGRDIQRALAARGGEQVHGPSGTDSERLARTTGSFIAQPALPEGVSVRALVEPDGRVSRAELVRGTRRPEADAAILRAVRRARFRPAQAWGEPVSAWAVIPITIQQHPPTDE